MSLVPMRALLRQAVKDGYAVGYFESWDCYSMEAVIAAAEATQSPAILGFGAAVADQDWLDRYGVEDLALNARRMAERAAVPTAVLFNEARSLSQIQSALDAGVNAVMLDSSELPFDANMEATAKVVELARRYGADVEAELGHLPEAINPDIHGSLTDPEQAATFVAATGVDALAVSIGNTHLVLDGAVDVDLEHLAKLGTAVGIPLVLHGGSGIGPDAVRAAVKLGVAKFNVGTRIKRIYLEGVRAGLPPSAGITDVHPYVGSHAASDICVSGANALSAAVTELIHLYGSAGKAGDTDDALPHEKSLPAAGAAVLP
jgi:ketose-bisphosphate aldolase